MAAIEHSAFTAIDRAAAHRRAVAARDERRARRAFAARSAARAGGLASLAVVLLGSARGVPESLGASSAHHPS